MALATFLVNVHSWPEHPQELIRFNILLHLLNTVMLVWLVRVLEPYLCDNLRYRGWPALAVGALWATSPLLMSASLMVIQRMTLLSATFTLAGLLLYVRGRECCAARPAAGVSLIALGLVGGTLLGVLSKENGVLLPVYALLLDRMYLSQALPTRTAEHRWVQSLRLALTLFPAVLIAVYLAYLGWQGTTLGFHGRTFTLYERLLTEARVLWDYLRLLVLPVRSALGPFHDDYVISRGLLSPSSTMAALIALASLVAVGWRLRRGRWKILSFGISWFLLAHSLESTVVPLEIYFEHRNYVPAMGLYIALVVALQRWRIRLRYKAALLLIMLCNFLFVLHENAKSWSDPLLAGMLWHRDHPDSLRAVQHLGRELVRRGQLNDYRELLDKPSSKLVDRADFRMVRLCAYCALSPGKAVRSEFEFVQSMLAEGYLSPVITEGIDKLADFVAEGRCNDIIEDDVLFLAEAVINNRNPSTRSDIRATAHEIAARLLLRRGRNENALEHLERAFDIRPTISDGISTVALLASMGRHDEAGRRLQVLRAMAPSRFAVRDKWLATVAEMQEIIDDRRAVALTQGGGGAE